MDISGDAGAAVADEAAKLGGDVLFEQCDVSSPQLDDVMERGIEWLGGLDVLANVAGIERGGTPQDSTEEQFDEILEPNLWATIRTNQIACPHMREAGGWTHHQLRVGRRHWWDADGTRVLGVEGRRARMVALDRA